MKDKIREILNNRVALLKRTQNLSTAQFNFVPRGFNNNIIWQLGHLLTTGDEMLYQNMPTLLPVYLFDKSKYGRGSKPDEPIVDPEVEWIKTSLVKSIEDYLYLIDSTHSALAFEKVAAVQFVPISEEWLDFLNFHETMHIQRINGLLNKLIRP